METGDSDGKLMQRESWHEAIESLAGGVTDCIKTGEVVFGFFFFCWSRGFKHITLVYGRVQRGHHVSSHNICYGLNGKQERLNDVQSHFGFTGLCVFKRNTNACFWALPVDRNSQTNPAIRCTQRLVLVSCRNHNRTHDQRDLHWPNI